MPHLTIEYTDNVPVFQAAPVLLALNQSLLDSGHFQEQDIKSRALRLDCYRTGTSRAARGYVCVKLAILSGRTTDVKSQLSQGLLAVLQSACSVPAGLEIQLSVEVLDMDRASYAKAVLSDSV